MNNSQEKSGEIKRIMAGLLPILILFLACGGITYAATHEKPFSPENAAESLKPVKPAESSAQAAPGESQPATSTDFLSSTFPLRSAASSDDVAMLISESCSQPEGSDGVSLCERAYSNGHHVKTMTQKMTEGDEFKMQVVIEEYNKYNGLVHRKTVRHRIDYNYYGDERTTEKELIDIVYESAGKKTNRDLMLRQYHLDTKKIKSLTWTQYEQVGETDQAELVYHATLRYDPAGTPLKGLAERWDAGQKTATYLDWDTSRFGNAGFDKVSWREWEFWIQSFVLQAYLP